jgi:hypothetical protein
MSAPRWYAIVGCIVCALIGRDDLTSAAVFLAAGFVLVGTAPSRKP